MVYHITGNIVSRLSVNLETLEQMPLLDALSIKLASSNAQKVTEDIWAFVGQYHDWVRILWCKTK
jgi:hypothetical protein